MWLLSVSERFMNIVQAGVDFTITSDVSFEFCLAR